MLLKDLNNRECKLFRYEIKKDLEKLFLIIGKIVKKIIYNNRDHVIFQDRNIIYSEKNIKALILAELNSNEILLRNEQIEEIKVKLTLAESLKDNEIKTLFLRYIGEVIALSLKSREEKILVFHEFGGNNVFHATVFEQHKIFNKITVFKGFRYKPIILKNKIAIILEPKARYFTELTLRDMLNQLSNDYDRSLVKLCPVHDCKHNLKSFTICDHGYPRSFGYISEIFLDYAETPSGDKFNIIEYFKDKDNCPIGKFHELIKDEPPVLYKTFSAKVEDSYKYPLELIKIVPRTEDAENKRRELAIEVKPPPIERYKRVEDSKDYLLCLRTLNFLIIPLHILDLDERYFNIVGFTFPKYFLKSDFLTENPIEDYRNIGFYKPSPRLKLYIIYAGKKGDYESYLKPLYDKSKSPNYLKFANIDSIEYEFIDVKNSQKIQNVIKNKNKSLPFFILVYRYESQQKISDLRKELYQKNIPNQSIKLKTLKRKGYSHFTNSIYYQIYHKSGGLTWLLKEDRLKDFIIISISVKFFLKKIYISILIFEHNGVFINGLFINEFSDSAVNELSDFLKKSSELNNKFLILINGLLSNEQKDIIQEAFEKKEFCCYRVDGSSIVRLFRTNNQGDVLNGLVKPGTGLFIDDQLHLITSEPFQGTQVGIKIQKLFSNIKNENGILEGIFHLTRYNPSFFRNSIKLPFPVHFSRKALTKGIKFELETFSFKIPFYL